jgi:hypothetical protein
MMEKFWLWIWVFTVATVGALVAILTKNDFTGLSREQKIRKITAGTITSIFVAYLTFEITLYFVGAERFSVACAGIASYLGTDALVALGNVFISLVTKGNKEK